MINPITRFLDLSNFEDEIREGRGLKIMVHGPQRQYIQVFVCDRKEFENPFEPETEQTEEPDVKGGK